MAERSTLKTIGYGTLVLSGSSAIGTAMYTAIRPQPHAALMVGFAAYNGGLTGATMFSLREWLVSPILVRYAPWQQYTRRRQELGLEQSPNDIPLPQSFMELRTDKLLDSAVSGAIAGGLLRGVRTGTKGLLPGMFFAGIVFTSFQYGANVFNIARLKYLSKQKFNDEPFLPPTMEQEPSKPLGERLLSMIGIRVLSDEEYLAKMKKKRDLYLEQIAELERRRNSEKELENES